MPMPGAPLRDLIASAADGLLPLPEGGAGRRGRVYLATAKEDQRRLALRLLPVGSADPRGLQRFVRTGLVLAGLRHPGLALTLDCGETDWPPPGDEAARDPAGLYVLEEYVPGISLRERLLHGPLPVAEALAVAGQVGQALRAAHRVGLVYRDLRPSQIHLATGAGGGTQARITGFGLARLLGPVCSRYLAPEAGPAGQDAACLDGRADQYALAVILHQCLTGRLPEAGGEAEAVLATDALLAAGPEALRRALSPDKHDRWESLDDFLAALAGAPEPAPRATGPHVLVLDDDEDSLAAVCDALAARGYQARGLDAAEDPLRWSAAPACDLLLIAWPEEEGAALAATLRALREPPRVLLLPRPYDLHWLYQEVALLTGGGAQ